MWRAFFLVLLVLLAFEVGAQPPAPQQPVAFSHKVHDGAHIECSWCHPHAAPGITMGNPQTASCMECHRTVKAESPEIQKLAALARKKRSIAWVRVYQNRSFVKFSHGTHLAAGHDCEACHGRVQATDQLFQERDISQVGCLACHTPKNVPFSCTFCHD